MLKPARCVLAALTFFALGGLTVGTAAGVQQTTSQRPKRAGQTEPTEFANPQIARLEMFIGVWNVTEDHLNARGDVVVTAKGTEEISWILDQHAIRRVYTTSTESILYRAIGTLTWNDVEKKYHGAWFDNVSTAGPTTTKGEWVENTLTLVFISESLAKDGSTQRHKIVEQLIDEENRVRTTYLMKGRNAVKRMEVRYKRARPCPGRLRVIFDDAIKGDKE